MLVRDVMIEDVRTANAKDAVRKVAGVICTQKISGLPVVDDDHNLMGIISEKDILNRLLPSYSDFLDDPIRSRDFEGMETAYFDVLSKNVGDLMTKKPFTVGPDDPVLLAASHMSLHNFRRIPVVEGAKLVGLVALSDIHKSIFKRELGLDG